MNHRTPTMTNLLNLTHTTRRCSRDTATLEGWITCASTPRAFSQRANQKPSRPASKASAIRVIFLPALTASSRQRCSRPRSLCHHIRAGVAVSFHYGAFRQVFTVAYLSAAVDKSDRPIQDELLTVNCESEAGRFRGENRLCKKIPLFPFTAQLVQLCQRAKRPAQ